MQRDQKGCFNLDLPMPGRISISLMARVGVILIQLAGFFCCLRWCRNFPVRHNTYIVVFMSSEKPPLTLFYNSPTTFHSLLQLAHHPLFLTTRPPCIPLYKSCTFYNFTKYLATIRQIRSPTSTRSNQSPIQRNSSQRLRVCYR